MCAIKEIMPTTGPAMCLNGAIVNSQLNVDYKSLTERKENQTHKKFTTMYSKQFKRMKSLKRNLYAE